MKTDKNGINILPERTNSKAIDIRKIGRKEGWAVIDHQKDKFMLSFRREHERINVYYSKMTVATCIDHPKRGKTQLFRKNIGMDALKKIFINPRCHTDKGYYSNGK